jgi:hypothetical protein
MSATAPIRSDAAAQRLRPTRDRSPRPPGSLPTGPAFGFLLAVFRVAGPAIPLRIAPISLVVGWSSVQSRTLSVAAFIGAALCGLALFAFVVWYGLFHFALP